jgi:hypothetical protein
MSAMKEKKSVKVLIKLLNLFIFFNLNFRKNDNLTYYKKKVISGDSKSPLMTTKLPLLPNSGDKITSIWWLLIIGCKCQIAATF